MRRLAEPVRLDCLQEHLAGHLAAAHAMAAVLPAVHRVAEMLCQRFASGGHIYTFGNGGSAADAQHFTGEIIGHYKRSRRALRP